MGQTVTETIDSRQLVVGSGIRTENAKPTAATTYKRGDLIAVSASNVATHPEIDEEDGSIGDWHAIVVEDMSAAQSTYHANNGLEMPIYVQGAFDVAVVTIEGERLAVDQVDAVRAQGLKNKIELRKVVG